MTVNLSLNVPLLWVYRTPDFSTLLERSGFIVELSRRRPIA